MKNNKGFWAELDLPIIGLSPMDGVTDASMRYIAKKHGHPSVVYTEFVSAEGLWRIKKRGEMEHKIWQELRYSEEERPVVAQIFGSDPESFYEASKIVCELGFDGIDINMGCPSPGLERRGGGAGLIRDKCNAVEVVEATRKGVADFFSAIQSTQSSCSHASTSLRSEGVSARDFGTSELLEKKNADAIPVSLKTRVGSDKPDRKWWELIASLQMPLVAMHGRTFKQLYSGFADWDLLLEAGEIIRESGALFLGNGDIKKVKSKKVKGKSAEGFEIVTSSDRVIDLKGKMDGVLVGRGAIGNPWILDCRSSIVDRSIGERLAVAVEHAKKFEELLPEQKFFVMRKHLVGYASGFDNASEIRRRLVQTNSAAEVEEVVRGFVG